MKTPRKIEKHGDVTVAIYENGRIKVLDSPLRRSLGYGPRKTAKTKDEALEQ